MFVIRQRSIDQSLQERFLKQPKLPKKSKRQSKKKTVAKVARKSYQIKRTTFDKTPLGDYLLKYCPVEYELINKAKSEGVGVSADLVEAIAYHSDNPAFRSVQFRKALTDFRRYRCRTPNRVEFNLESEIAAIKNKLKINSR